MSYMPVEQLMTADEYLQWQALQEVPHELIAGHLHPLPPRDRVFFRLLVNLTSAIQGQRGERADWETSLSDCPLVVSDHDVLLPDAFVARIGACHSPHVALAVPATTRRIADRRRLDAQRRIATLLELVIVDRETRTVTVEMPDRARHMVRRTTGDGLRPEARCARHHGDRGGCVRRA